MKKFMLLVTIASFTIINEVLAATPCDSHLRKMRPDLFKHCDNACPYGQWGSWSIISKFRTDQCNSSKAYNQTRTRHSFIKTCPSQSESKAICQPTIEEKALIFIKALDLGIKQPITTSATKSPSASESIQHSTTNNPFATQRSATRQPSIFPNQFLFQREKRQIQPCPTGVHKICQDSTRRKRESIEEISNNSMQTIPNIAISDSIIPEPFDVMYYLSTAQVHRRRKRMASSSRCTNNDRYLLFMLDTSGSIGNATFTRMTAKLSELVFYFCGNTKIAAMTFGSHIYHEFCFNCEDINAVDKIRDAIKSIPYHGGGTHTAEALKCACDNILTVPCGLPKRRKYRRCPAPIDVVMITDSHSNGQLDACEEAKCLHSHPFYDISTFTIGVGNNVDENELKCIQNLDSDDLGHIFFDVDSFDELEKLIGKVFKYLLTPIDDPSSNENAYHMCYNLDNPLNR